VPVAQLPDATGAAKGIVQLAGDLAGTAAAPAVASNAVSNAKLRDSVGTSVIGRAAGSTGDPADIAAAADGHYLRRAAGALGFGTIASADLGSGTADATTFLRGDRTWQPAPAGLKPVSGGLFVSWYQQGSLNPQPVPGEGPLILQEIRPTINWTDRNPGGLTDYYNCIIVGWIKPRYTQRYTIYLTSDDGVMCSVAGRSIVDTGAWKPQGPTAYGNDLDLQADKLYPIVICHFEYNGGESLKLEWSSASQALEVISRATASTTPIRERTSRSRSRTSRSRFSVFSGSSGPGPGSTPSGGAAARSHRARRGPALRLNRGLLDGHGMHGGGRGAHRSSGRETDVS